MVKASRSTGSELTSREAVAKKTDSETGMFTLEVAQDTAARVIVMGRPSRKRATTFLNIPISSDLRQRLGNQVIGSLAMGTGALLEWALKELERQGISIKAKPRD